MTAAAPTISVRVHGAAGEVTGSCYEVTTPHAHLLVDFGMFQGSMEQESRNLVAPDLDFKTLDAVLVTHAHVDHCGRLGMLPALGFHGPVLATEPTAELLPRVLISSATLQQTRIQENRAGTAPTSRVLAPAHLASSIPIRTEPPPVLFMHRDAEKVARSVRALPFMEWEPIAQGVEMRFLHASHVIGAASIELRVQRAGSVEPARVLFSGDIGPISNPLLAPHQWSDRAPDLLVMESTNGARRFAQVDQYQEFIAILKETRDKGQRLLAPVFALGRAQTMLQLFARASSEGILRGMPVYLDSAMASRACELYARHPALLEASVHRACMRGTNPLHFPELHTLMSRRESESVDRIKTACVILAGSGFCDAGPILRHVKLAIDQPDTRILFTGHQLDGLLGHGLLSGATRVEINGAALDVRAKIDRITGISGHGDSDDLLEWVKRMPGSVRTIALTHGSEEARGEFAAILRQQLPSDVRLPMVGDTLQVE
ncbi:MAG: MBL fold metallo-hydrolase [Phycisphaerales bacterium]|nr:MBL fold metallo-hydrolase [Phycisphaerales bacterium]